MTMILPDRATSVAPLSAHVAGVVTSACRCGHGAESHEHWRAGSDCATCGCRRFRAERAGIRVFR
ncbi:hypothetical protein [Pseudonocardia pini]|uniref:hypothetical protein n=1 Tax=Pseudonocardia pini TaxID=2758030 RepID=UPI0015EFF6AB|nr:hypothetical protein [Pseudonocardia pini]